MRITGSLRLGIISKMPQPFIAIFMRSSLFDEYRSTEMCTKQVLGAVDHENLRGWFAGGCPYAFGQAASAGFSSKRVPCLSIE